jgi:hypothetical protein
MAKAMRKASATRRSKQPAVAGHPDTGPHFKRPPLVEVKWRDATGKVGWLGKKDLHNLNAATVYSAGYLVVDEPLGIKLAQDIAYDTDDTNADFDANGLGVIPRACIVWIKVLREAGKL